MSEKKITYSMILPVYNEEKNIQTLYDRLSKTCASLKDTYELLFVNDGSHDATNQLIMDLNKKDSCVKMVSFSRNFGHQMAVSAGMKYAAGSIVCILDADLQDPPEVLPQFIKKIHEGYDVVYAIRTRRKEGILKRSMYALFYRLLRLVANIAIPLDSGDFCVMSRRAVNEILLLPERNRFIRGLRSWVGFAQTGIEYERNVRFAGESKYTMGKLFKLAFDGIFSFSYVPLQILTFAGFIFFFLSVVLSFVTVYFKLFTSVYIPRGFPTTIITILFIGGINMLSLGIIGEYIGRIYDEVKRRSPYIVAETVGI